jgi:hypothetical protein
MADISERIVGFIQQARGTKRKRPIWFATVAADFECVEHFLLNPTTSPTASDDVRSQERERIIETEVLTHSLMLQSVKIINCRTN